mgnify:CR=1 FL=1
MHEDGKVRFVRKLNRAGTVVGSRRWVSLDGVVFPTAAHGPARARSAGTGGALGAPGADGRIVVEAGYALGDVLSVTGSGGCALERTLEVACAAPAAARSLGAAAGPIRAEEAAAFASIAVTLGTTRLLDNVLL